MLRKKGIAIKKEGIELIFKVSDCNYAVLSNEERQKFVKRYSKLFNQGIPFKVILTPEKANNDFGTGYRNIYFSCEDEASVAVADMLSSIGTEYKKIPENEFAPILRFRSKHCDYAECSLWGKDVSDRLLTSLCSISDSTLSAVIVTFDPLSSKEEDEYLRKKAVKYARHNGIVNKIKSYLVNGKKLYRIRLKVITAGDTQEQAKAFMDSLIDKADEFGCKLHRPSEKKSTQIKKLAKKLLHDDKCSKICTEKTCTKFVPFFSADFNDNSETAFDYGVNQITKNQLLYDRKNSKLANGIVFGMAGSGKTVYVKNEVLQVLDKTEDDIIILDPDDTFGYTYDEFQGKLIRIDEFQGKLTRIDAHSNFCINSLDIVIDTFDGMTETIAEKADFVVGLLESLLPNGRKYGRECNKYETKLVLDAVYQVLTPFVNKLKKNYDGKSACVYDFENNPTLKDVLDVILSQDNEETQEFRELLTAQMPYLEAFCHKTMTFGNRVIFDLYHVPCKLTAAYYMAIISYTNNRMLLNYYEQFNAPITQYKHLWFYFDEANRMLKNKDFADFVRMLYQRSHRYGMICTAVVQSFSELIETEQGQAIFNNSGFRVFLAQSVLDRMLTKKMLNVSDEMLDFTNDPPIGSGIFYNYREMIPFHS